MEKGKQRKVYLLSEIHGTWQVGRTVYCLPLGSSYDVDSYPRRFVAVFDVPIHLVGWEAVEYANAKYKQLMNKGE